FGAKIWLYNNGRVQYQEQNPVRGYFASVDQRMLFGLGDQSKVDSIVAIWPDGKKQILTSPKVDTVVTLSWEKADSEQLPGPLYTQTIFSDITASAGVSYKHHENSINDFAVQRLLPQKHSQLGPFIATGDINK